MIGEGKVKKKIFCRKYAKNNSVVSVADPIKNVSLRLYPGRTELVTLVQAGSRAGRTHSQ